MPADKSGILQGTLDLMVLKTLAAMGPLHGYGIARRIEQISEEALQINQGTIYASLVRLLYKSWIVAAWAHRTTIAKPSSIPLRNPDESSSMQKHGTGTGFLA
jgi:DNA-binding PadR family transcriptional regulator